MTLETLIHLPDFLLYAFAGGLLLAMISAPLGVFVVWQKQSYFGAALAHSALLGVSLGLWWQMDLTLAVIAVSILAALSIDWLTRHTRLPTDTLLGIFAHASLAFALIFISLKQPAQLDIMAYLFGDILSLQKAELVGIVLLGVWVTAFFWRHWSDMLNLTLNADLAQIEGVHTRQLQRHYLLLLAILIGLAIKVVGVLLITSLLIMPAASARRFARSPEGMLIGAIIMGGLSVLGGLLGSFLWDLPTGPAIVATATGFFLFSLFKRAR
ncbi:metal ABC transporter permease [Hydrogenovibrio halophilus]|uniref:metal ABC transporter permease n=1 Tax=Hydrogenovibrio halophilus TaxID=373391 RepID=UPI00037684CF|nr:metal ABC transporter permease [Hydrogenovibrio halophilus]